VLAACGMTGERGTTPGVDDDRRQLINDLLQALDTRQVVEGTRLIELMRMEQNLLDSLALVRRLIDSLVRNAGLG
jgi:mevalonate kinase